MLVLTCTIRSVCKCTCTWVQQAKWEFIHHYLLVLHRFCTPQNGWSDLYQVIALKCRIESDLFHVYAEECCVKCKMLKMNQAYLMHLIYAYFYWSLLFLQTLPCVENSKNILDEDNYDPLICDCGLLRLAIRIEHLLYLQAKSFDAYTDKTTLRARVILFIDRFDQIRYDCNANRFAPAAWSAKWYCKVQIYVAAFLVLFHE